MIISGYYPGFRGYQPGYYNPYARFGYPGYSPLNYNLLNRNLLTRPLTFRPVAVPAPVAAKDEVASLTQGTQYHFRIIHLQPFNKVLGHFWGPAYTQVFQILSCVNHSLDPTVSYGIAFIGNDQLYFFQPCKFLANFDQKLVVPNNSKQLF